MKALRIAAVTLALFSTTPASAAVTVYTDSGAFASALDGSYTLANLDAGALGALAAPYTVQSSAAAAAFSALGMSFAGFNATVAGGQDYQIATPGRDRLILFGKFFGGQLTINFATPVNGVGWRSNNGDGGRVIAYSDVDLGGTQIGTGNVGSGAFGGLISDSAIRSIQLTCDFNGDFACGAYDIQFGTLASATPAIPEPATWAMMIAGFGMTGAALRRRTTRQLQVMPG
ncbi:MAG TPA: PEPxxWA-CTERM sorting domain-containing protein [Sphingobium sp.]|nr:PEPxxWA-CTERM sorting domain-containing protein [Sphingobium sp.]